MDSTESTTESPAEGLPRRRGRKTAIQWSMRGLRMLVLIFGGALIVLYFEQDRMIFPGASTQGEPYSQIQPRSGEELLKLSAPDGERIVARFGPALSADGKPLPDAASRPALIYFYGNAMCANDCDRELDRFRRLGLNVMVPDYLGYGGSGGRPSEVGCRETADACFQDLRSRGFRESRIIAAGWSLGGAVAIDLASRHRLGGLIAFSTFTSTRDMGKTIFPIPLPHWFFRNRFESLRKIATVNCPILLGHGRRDSLIPFSMFEQLAAATSPPASQIIIDDADHNDFFEVGGRKLFDAIARYVSEAQSNLGTPQP